MPKWEAKILKSDYKRIFLTFIGALLLLFAGAKVC